MKKWGVLLWVVLWSSISAASGYHIKTVKVKPIETYPAKTELDGITIAADPYSTDAKSYSAFDFKHLNSRGYFPLHVIIKNGTSKYLTIGTRNIVLVTSTGQQLYTTPSALIVEEMGGDLSMKSNSTSSDVGSPLFDFTNKELANRLIDPGTVNDGFLFFFTPRPRTNPFVGSTLYIPKIEEDGTHDAIGPFFIPLDPAVK